MVDSISVTFRISNKKIEALKSVAEEKRISLNVLVNNILDSYLEWEYHAPKVGFVPMQKSVLKDLFDAIPDETIMQIATKAADKFRDELMMIYGKVDLESMISFTKNRITRSGFVLREFEGSGEEGERRMVIKHDVGPKWALFSKIYIERLINNVGQAAKVETVDNTLVVEILAC
ncbi:MAG TPA: hypothetical protein VHA09_00635 [Nitrososphaera sp.]|nr:hypothetical protein [Nitrososphaera sp.]